MATFQRFTDIEVWQKCRELTNEIYKITKEDPFLRTSNCVRRYEPPVSPRCRISRRASRETVRPNSYSFYQLQKVRWSRWRVSFMLPLTKGTSLGQNSTG